MPELALSRYPGSIQPNMKRLVGVIEITGGAGAILFQTGQRNCGVTFTKNAAAGRYDAVIHRGYKRCFGGSATVMQPVAGVVLAVTAGADAVIQGVSSANTLGTSPISTFTIQVYRPDTNAAADVPATNFISWSLDVSDSP